MTNEQKIKELEQENESLREYVAFMLGEGNDEIPEEVEYKQLVSISPDERDEDDVRRLRYLVKIIMEKLDLKRIRIRLKSIKELLNNIGCQDCSVDIYSAIMQIDEII